jgi:hypothetical protein
MRVVACPSGREDAVIFRIFFGILAYTATVAVALEPDSAVAATSYDGVWHVSIVTQKGECASSYHYPIRITSGALSNENATGLAISGRVSGGGQVSVVVISEKGKATGHGQLEARSGNGTWRGEACSGNWTAQRGSNGRTVPYQ